MSLNYKRINRRNKERRKCSKSWSVEVVLLQCSLVENQHRQKSKVLYTFMFNKSYAYLLNIESSNLVFLNTYSTEFDDSIITFTNQNGRPREIEDKVN